MTKECDHFPRNDYPPITEDWADEFLSWFSRTLPETEILYGGKRIFLYGDVHDYQSTYGLKGQPESLRGTAPGTILNYFLWTKIPNSIHRTYPYMYKKYELWLTHNLEYDINLLMIKGQGFIEDYNSTISSTPGFYPGAQ